MSERLSDEAVVAISIEHQRDHDDGPGLSRDGCLGCRMIAEIAALRARCETLAAALRNAEAYLYDLRTSRTWDEVWARACSLRLGTVHEAACAALAEPTEKPYE